MGRFALLIGTGCYDDAELRPLGAASWDVDVLGGVLADPAIGGFEVTRMVDRSVQELRVAVEDFLADRVAGDFVLVYLSCHGVLDLRGRLGFAATDTRKSRVHSTALPASWLGDLIADCRADGRVLVLDCCFSGAHDRAKAVTDATSVQLGGLGSGLAVLTASRGYEFAYEGDPSGGSVFTTGLVEGLRTGAADRDGDGLVTVEEAFAYAADYVRGRGTAQNPQRWLTAGEGDLVLARSLPGPRPVPLRLPLPAEAEPVPAAPAVFHSAYARLNKALMAFVLVAATVVLGLGMDEDGKSASPYAMAAAGLLMLSAWAVQVWLPHTHTLDISAQGMVLRSRDRTWAVDWVEVDRVQLTALRRGDFGLVITVRPGIRPPRPTVWTPGPERGGTEKESVFVRTRQLLVRPIELDDALRRFAGTAHVGSPEIEEQRASEAAAAEVEVFTTNQRALRASGTALVAIAIAPLVTLAAPTSGVAAVVAAVTALVWAVPGLALLVCAHHPARLRLDKHGLRYSRHGKVVELSWHDIDKAGLTRFLRQSSGPRHLRLRLSGGVHRDLALVDMLSLSTSTARLSAAFARFAGDRWVTRYRPDRGVRTTAHATHFEGWAAGWQTLAAPLATVVAISYAPVGLEVWFGVNLGHDLHGPTELMALLAVFACGFGVLLASRRRCTLTLDDTGVEMRLGRERANVGWDDVRHIQLVTRRSQAKNKYTGEHDTGTEIVLIPSRDGISTAPWKLVAFLRRQHGALLLCTIDHFWLYLDTSDEALDRALRRHAGPRRRLPPTTREVLPGKSH